MTKSDRRGSRDDSTDTPCDRSCPLQRTMTAEISADRPKSERYVKMIEDAKKAGSTRVIDWIYHKARDYLDHGMTSFTVYLDDLNIRGVGISRKNDLEVAAVLAGLKYDLEKEGFVVELSRLHICDYTERCTDCRLDGLDIKFEN